jgi:hypothetical protein
VVVANITGNTGYYIGSVGNTGTASVIGVNNAFTYNPSTQVVTAPTLNLMSNLNFSTSAGIFLNTDIKWFLGGSQKVTFDNGGNNATFRITTGTGASDLVLNASYNVATQIAGNYKLEVLSDKITSYVPIRTNVATGEGNGILFSLPGYSAYQYNGANIFSGTADNYDPTSVANPLCIGSWNGIAFHCNADDTVRGGFDTRTGSMAISGAFKCGGTLTLAGYTLANSTQFGIRMGSMFIFSSAGTWDGSNCLFVTSGGMGGTSPGVGFGYSTANDAGYLVCIAPNVAWKSMNYKANGHYFQYGGNTVGLSIDSSGVKTIGVPNISVGDIATGGQYRAICISVGVIQRNDEGNYYFLVTNAGDPYGTWNGLRPLFFSLGSGMLYSNNGQIFEGGLNTTTLRSSNIIFSDGYGLQTNQSPYYGSVSAVSNAYNWPGYSIGSRYTFMANSSNGNTSGVHDLNNSWLIRWENGVTHYDRSSFVYNALPQQSYKPGQVLIAMNGQQIQYGQQYSTWYYAQVNWGGGLLLAEFTKVSSFSFIRVSGWVTKYSPNADISSYIIRMVNSSTGGIYDYYQRSFINATYQHESFGCMVQADIPAGYYLIYLYQVGNTITDSNDFVSLLIEVTPH